MSNAQAVTAQDVDFSLRHDSDIDVALKDFGLSDVEAAVYQASLRLGSRPASVIAKCAGLKRGQTYNLLRNLVEKGLVQELLRNNVCHYSPSQPETLLSIISRRKEELREQEKRISTIIPALEKLTNPYSNDQKVRFFRGAEGIKELCDDMLKKPGQVIDGFVDLDSHWSTVDAKTMRWRRSFVRRRADAKIVWRGIVAGETDAMNEDYVRPSKFRIIKRLPGVSLPAAIHILDDKVIIIGCNNELMGTLIESAATAATLKAMHEIIWGMLPEFMPPELP